MRAHTRSPNAEMPLMSKLKKVSPVVEHPWLNHVVFVWLLHSLFLFLLCSLSHTHTHNTHTHTHTHSLSPFSFFSEYCTLCFSFCFSLSHTHIHTTHTHTHTHSLSLSPPLSLSLTHTQHTHTHANTYIYNIYIYNIKKRLLASRPFAFRLHPIQDLSKSCNIQ